MELHLTNRTIEDKGNQGHFSPRVHLISSVLIVKYISLWKLVLKDIWKALGCNKQMCWCPENYYYLWLTNNTYLPCLSTIINIVSRRHGFPFLLSKMYVASLFGGFRFLFLVCGLSSWFKPLLSLGVISYCFCPRCLPTLLTTSLHFSCFLPTLLLLSPLALSLFSYLPSSSMVEHSALYISPLQIYNALH